MPTPSSTRFDCPKCGTPYTLLRVEADATSEDGEIACTVCGEPLRARDEQFVLKYFLMRRSGMREGERYSVV
jgi:transcription elongation factor Elf1